MPHGMHELSSWPGIELLSPAVGHRVLTTGSPGKSLYLYLKFLILFLKHIFCIWSFPGLFCVYVFFPPACTLSCFVSLCVLWFLTLSWYLQEWFEASLTSFSWEDLYLSLSGIWGTFCHRCIDMSYICDRYVRHIWHRCHRHLYTKYSTWSFSFLLHSVFTEANLLHPLGGGNRWVYFSVHTYMEDLEPHWGSNFM